jgi:hypothetical protein
VSRVSIQEGHLETHSYEHYTTPAHTDKAAALVAE